MSRHQRALLALWGTTGLLTAPWVIDYAVRRARRESWRPPAVPRITVNLGRLNP